MAKPSTRLFFLYWLPVLVWLGVIFTESMSPFAASDQTSRIVIPVLHWLFPRLQMEQLEVLHHLLRKVGHFTGYGLLSYLFFRAFRAMHHLRNSTMELMTRAYRRSNPVVFSECWRTGWFFLAMLGTFVVASADELHQMTLANRTGSWWDVLLDCTGGLVFQILLLIFCKVRAQAGQRVAARAEA